MASASRCGPIFIVEDDEAVREALAEVLEDEGYVVRLAKNGVDALTRLRASETLPCVILLDLMMPVMDGFEFRARQLDDRDFRDIPVVILSAYGTSPTTLASLKVASALRKPVRMDDVLRAVAQYCEPAAHAAS